MAAASLYIVRPVPFRSSATCLRVRNSSSLLVGMAAPVLISGACPTRQEAQAHADVAADVCGADHRGSNEHDGYGHETSRPSLAGCAPFGAISATCRIARGDIRPDLASTQRLSSRSALVQRIYRRACRVIAMNFSLTVGVRQPSEGRCPRHRASRGTARNLPRQWRRSICRCAHDGGTHALAGDGPADFGYRLSSRLRIGLTLLGPIQEAFWLLANSRQRRSIAT